MKFAYQAFDSSGQASRGEIDAADKTIAGDMLRRRGLFVSDLEEAGEAQLSKSASFFGRGRQLRNVAMFSRQLHVLVSSGTPLLQALNAVERQVDEPHWQSVVKAIRESVEQGSPISDAMKRFPDVFDAVCLSLVSAGETSGDMPAMLDRMATLCRKQLKLRSMIISALIYPSLLISLGVAVMFTMLLFVLPRFSDLFKQLDAPLPPTTKLLMWMSETLWNYWWLLAPLFLAACSGVFWWFASGRGKRWLDSVLPGLPKVGKLFRSVMTARIARMLGVLLESRVALLTALKLSRESLVHADYSGLIAKAEEAVGRGEPISSILSSDDLISPPVQEAIRTGELSGKLGAPLVQMADFLDEENDVIIKTLTSLIEPVILIILGLLVGFVALSMFLPLFDLVSAAQRGGH